MVLTKIKRIKGGYMQEIFMVIINSEISKIIFKIFLITILSGFIGLERETLSKPAGLKTHILLGISAVLTMICGEYIFTNVGGDMSRIPAQLLSGIGFLGAGTILRDGFNVRGLTTAASLLAVACIGLCVGAGLYVGGIIATIVVYIILENLSFPTHLSGLYLEIITENAKQVVENVEKLLNKNKVEIKRINIIDEDEKQIVQISGQYKKKTNNNKVISSIMKIDGISTVEEINE